MYGISLFGAWDAISIQFRKTCSRFTCYHPKGLLIEIYQHEQSSAVTVQKASLIELSANEQSSARSRSLDMHPPAKKASSLIQLGLPTSKKSVTSITNIRLH